MLVYLDSAQLAWLEAAQQLERTDFLRAWNDAGVLLALSFTHVYELSRLKDAESMERRLTVIRGFDEIRFSFNGSASIVDMEIEAKLLNLLGGQVETAEVRNALFPESTADSFAEHVQVTRKQFRTTSRIAEAAADADNWSNRIRTEVSGGRQPKKLKNTPVDAPKLKDHLAEYERIRTLITRVLTGAGPKGDESGSTREFLETDFGLRDVPYASDAPDEDLSRLATFYNVQGRQVAEELSNRLGIDLEQVLKLLYTRVSPYHCPGHALMLGLRRQRLKSTARVQASHQADEWHVAAAPYVDLLFVDNETRTYLDQAADTNPDLIPLGVLPRIITAADLGDVIRVVVE